MSKELCFEELVRRLKSDEFNFVGFIVTPWHLLGVRALLTRLEEEGRNIRHLICVMPHAETGYVFDLEKLPEDCFYLKEGMTPVLDTHYFKKWFLLVKSQIGNLVNPIYIASSWNYRVNTTICLSERLKRKFILCKIDEGVATYMYTSNSLYLSIQNRNPHLFVRTILSRILQLFLRHRLNCNLLLKKNGKIKPNEIIVPYYKKILINDKKMGSADDNKLIIIATMAFPENDVYNNEIINKLDVLIPRLKEEGYICEIKPHPRENNPIEAYSKYNIKIVNNSCSMEEYLIANQPRCIISLSSTALITSKLFYDVKPISFVNILDLNNFSQKYYNEMVTFREVFKNIVNFPNSVKELMQEISC